MMRRAILGRHVPQDLRTIVQYLDEHSTSAGDRFITSFFATLDELVLMPGKGSPKQFRSKSLRDVRSWWVPGFRKFIIYYRIVSEGVEVLAVTHGSRKIRALLLGRV